VTDEQRALSHDRLVQAVAEVSLEYDLTDSRIWSTPRPPPSPDLPGRFVESDLPLDDAADKTEKTGTQLAGALAEPVAPTGPAGIQLPAVGPAAPLAAGAAAGIGPVRPAATLSGAGTGLASSAPAAQLSAPSAGSAGASTGAAAAALPPPVMGAGVGSAATSEPIVRGRGRGFTTDTSWSSDDDRVWTRDDEDDPPPAILGQTSRPA
jgi:hypothetical protein